MRVNKARSLFNALSCLLLLVSAGALAEEPTTGPIIENFGPVYPVPADSYNLLPDESYRVAFDVAKGPDDMAAINRGIESAARFLNMHARNGIDIGKLEVAVVLHGGAARASLLDEAHQQKYGAANGSRELITALHDAGVKIYLCGQSAAYREFKPEELLPEVTLAVSAMTAHVRLQQEGYRIIPF